MPQLYTPPEGFYDLPFTWVYDASALTDGSDYPNQFVYIQGGYGDFILRRVAGMTRVLHAFTGVGFNEGGRYLLYDAQGRPLQGGPICPWSNNFSIFGGIAPIETDFGMVPEVFYKETSNIKFDLANVLRDTDHGNALSAQIAFQGVRRVAGTVQKPNMKAKTPYFGYDPIVAAIGPAGSVITRRRLVTDYPFELYNLLILVTVPDSAQGGGESQSTVTIKATIGVADYTVDIDDNNGTPGQVFSFVSDPVTRTITVRGATDGGGSPTTTGTELGNAWNADAFATSVGSITIDNLPGLLMPDLFQVLTGGTLGILDRPYAKLMLYDQHTVQTASAPVLDLFMDGNQNGVYKTGALVPPLWYRKDSQIQIDFTSIIVDPALEGAVLQVYPIGRQYYPC